MKPGKVSQLFQYIKKSRFIRSIFFETVSVFLVVILITVTVLFLSFRADINGGIISDQKNQLDILESSISLRMEEVTSIAYNVGQDPIFYIEPVDGIKYSGYELSNSLSRYLIGNRFIKHIAFYRLSEPDTIYTSNGQLSFHRFWESYLSSENYNEESFLEQIKTQKGVQFIKLLGKQDITYFAYICPLPQFSLQPLAFVIALIPLQEIAEPMSAQLMNEAGIVTVFDAKGDVIYSVSTMEEDISLKPPEGTHGYEESRLKMGSQTFVVQSKVSATNGWSFVSAMRLDNIISELASTQVLVIIMLILLMIVAVFIILLGIINKYKPISNLALTLTDQETQSVGGIVDERTLLSSTIETLKSDSEQKQIFEEAYYEANEANRAKSAFLSNMSHDIRTPMNAVIGMISLAQKHISDRDYVKDCLQKANVASHFLLELINNVLDMSRIESGKITISEGIIRLPDLVYGLITMINSSIKDKEQRLIVDTDAIHDEVILGDSLRLTQVCMNILSNAVKFTPDGGTIRISISQSESKTQGVGEYIFTFSDNGIGISPDFVKEVFDPFVRAADSSTSKIEGTGLGMAIAKNLVEMMEGTIVCESQLGEGTTFTVTLPLKIEAVKADELPVSFDGSSILILGDDTDVCIHQAKLFAELGFTADYAVTQSEAAGKLDKARKENAPYSYLLINFMNTDKSSVSYFEELIIRGNEAVTIIIIAASEFSVSDNSAYDSVRNEIYMRTPLFRSTIINTLGQNKELSDSERYADNDNTMFNGKRVLLVEDNQMNRFIAHSILSEAGIEVIEAENGRAAVNIFAENTESYFDLILMDVQMPEMNGLEATSAIRSMNRHDAETIPIYAMTANTFDEDVREVMKVGMNGHLGKPYSPDELYELLHKSMQ